MAKPIILTVDDDPDVLQAVSRDLRHQYSDRFRVVRADSGQAGCDGNGQTLWRRGFTMEPP